MNVQDVHAGRIFDNAQYYVKSCIGSKSAKIDKKLKMVDLQVKKQKLDPRHRSRFSQPILKSLTETTYSNLLTKMINKFIRSFTYGKKI